MRVSLIITAAGASTRFTKTLPSKSLASKASSKLFFELGGMPVLERTIKAFSNISSISEIFVTVSTGTEKESKVWGDSVGLKKIKWVTGGKTRAESVFNALQKTSPKNDWVMVHDGARPLIKKETIKKILKKAPAYDGLLLAKQVVPTLKKVSAKGSRVEATVDRASLAEAETPQIVRRKVLLNAYQRVPNALSFTDESGLVEAAGGEMGVLLHTDWNPKLTHFADYELAQAKLSKGEEIRIGKGYDIHRLVSGRKLWVGGVRIPFEKGSLGHSDGDALLHSITDAILGALGLGDIGDWFSDKSKKYKNIQSSKLLTQVLEKTRESGWHPYQVDTNVILEKPRLGPVKLKIRKSLAKLLRLSLDRISVKARTHEGFAPIGTGEAWACQAVVVMKKNSDC